MLEDYKGEVPNNVTTPEQAKGQKPFYKNWKFWFLTGLMTLFGACSIYGLVLGSQYVKAVNEAAHIIADAQDAKSETLSKNKVFAYNVSDNYTHYVDLGTLWWNRTTYTSVNYYYFVVDIPSDYPIVSRSAYVVDAFTNGGWGYIEGLTTDEMILIQPNSNRLLVRDDAITTGAALKTALSGKYLYYLTTANSNIYSDAYGAGENDGYSDGYTQGSADGYEDGYQDGYSDGSDAINVNQSVKVLLPAGAENSCSYVTYLDGVPDQQGILSSSSSFGAYGEFNRDRNQKLRIDLTLPSGSRAFFMYVPQWTSAYPSDENYSLRQSWAVSGVTYLPTWVAKPEIYVGITSALVDDLTYDTISVAFDVDHWGDVKVGAYQEGYQQGYVDGQENPTAYDSGYEAGYGDGHAQGETEGFNRGFAAGSSGSQSLAMMFKTAFQLPFDQLYRFLNFNLLGINFLSLFTALISVSIGIMVIKKVL